jgi:hypothetical protein
MHLEQLITHWSQSRLSHPMNAHPASNGHRTNSEHTRNVKNMRSGTFTSSRTDSQDLASTLSLHARQMYIKKYLGYIHANNYAMLLAHDRRPTALTEIILCLTAKAFPPSKPPSNYSSHCRAGTFAAQRFEVQDLERPISLCTSDLGVE